MNPRALTNFYSWAIKILILAIPFLSLWIASSLYFPYITGRNFVFRILIELALALWVGLMLLDKSYRPRPSLILWALLSFTVIVGVADLFGVDPYHSFWSKYERMEGYLMILHLLAYFLILTSVFRTKREWRSLFNLFVIAGVLVGSYGVLQVLGIKEAIQGGDVRIDGTIGNPTYLAAYLFLVTSLAGILFINTERRALKYLYGAAVIFNLIIMYFTASRGLALTLLITIPLFLLLYLLFFRGEDGNERRYKKIAIGLLVLMILGPIVFWLLRNQSFIQNSEVLSRFASVSLGERTIKARFVIWNMSLAALKERPILGWGQENYIQVFSKYYDPRLYDQEPWFDRSHNIVFDWLINAGVLGFIAYISIFVAFYITWRGFLNKRLINKKEALILFIVPIGYFLQNIFVFDNFNTYVLFFSLLAYASNLSKSGAVLPVGKPLKTNESKNGLVIHGVVALIGAVATIALIYFVNVRPWQQARGIIKALQATTANTDPVGRTLEVFKKTLAYNTLGNTETLEQLVRIANLLVNQEIPEEAKLNFINFASSKTEEYLEDFPNDSRLHIMLGTLYQISSHLNNDFITKARDHLQTALKLSPKKQPIFLVLAENYLRNQEIPKAFELMEEAIALEPSNPETHTTKALMAALAGRDDLVVEAVNALNELRLEADEKNQGQRLADYLRALERVGDLYVRTEQYAKAKVIFEQLLRVSPNPDQYQEILTEIQTKLEK